MAKNLFQSDQMKNDAALTEIAPSANTPLDTLFSNINSRVKDPAALSMSGLVLTVGHTILTTGPLNKKKGLPQIKSVAVGDLTGTFDFETGTGTGDVQSVTLPTMTASYYVRAGVEVRSDKKIYIVFGTEAASASAAGAPAFAKTSAQRGEILLQDDGTGGQGNFVTHADNAGVTEFGAGSGGGSGTGLGSLNYVDNYDAEIDVSKWVTYNDGASATPVDGTGGTVDPGFTLTRESSLPLRGVGSFRINKPGSNVQGHGVSTDLLTFDNADMRKTIEFYLDYSGSGLYAGDISVFIYDVTNAGLITPLGNKVIPTGAGRFIGRFQPASNSVNYRLILHVTTTSVQPCELDFDMVSVGPINQTETLFANINQAFHGFSVGDIIANLGGTWLKAIATTLPEASGLAFVSDVTDMDNVVVITHGKIRTTNSVISGGAKGWAYLSGTTAGAVTYTDNQSSSVPVYYVTAAGEAFFAPQRITKLSEEGDLSFRPRSNTSDGTMLLRGGVIRIDDGTVIVSGTGSVEDNYKMGITLNLNTILGTTPAVNTTYWLYIDRYALSAPSTLTDSGRVVYRATGNSHFKLFTSRPDEVNPYRYVEVAYVRSSVGGLWSTASVGAFGYTASRLHPSHDFVAFPDKYATTVNTAAVHTLTHGLSGEPQIIQLYYYDGTGKVGLDISSHVQNKSSTQLVISTFGLTFGGGQYVEVNAFYAGTVSGQVVSNQTQFRSSWFQNTSTTTLPHGLSNVDDIKGLAVIEWDVTTNRYRVLDALTLVDDFDGTNLYLNWGALSPSAMLQYQVVTGGNPLPQSLPIYMGGYTKFVGRGPGSYATLAAAIAASTAGDSILVCGDETITSTVTVNVADLTITWMPGVYTIIATNITTGFAVTGARTRLKSPNVRVTSALTSFFDFSATGDDCHLEGGYCEINATAQTIAQVFNLQATASRNYINASINKIAGTLTTPWVDAGTDNELMVRGS
jgi:hypothetical protein